MTVSRRLAAILAADVAGYSRLMGADEEGTLDRLKAHRRELIDPQIAEHHGRIVKTTGDGMLVEFASVVDAVRCAVEVQQRMGERNANVPDDARITFRVGINLGDIIIDGDDIHGDGVNIAARLEAMADPGTVCLSGTAYDHIRDKLDYAFDDLGEQSLKNIARPVRVYRVRSDATSAQRSEASAKPSLALPDKPSIAVLPFTNMSGDPEQEYFADGIVEEITTALSRLKWFFVIARNSSFTYKDRAVDVKQVACELGVRYVLEGSVRKAGSRLRITSQLIDAATGNHIWAERYDREIADIFAVQDEITESVVASIEPRLYAAENIRIQGNPPESLDAWGCVIRALWHLGRMSKDDNEQAKQLLGRAIELSPRYAKAHSLLAWAEVDAVFRGVSKAEAALPVARQHLRTALALDDDDPWMFFAAGVIDLAASRYEDSIAAFRRAIEQNPNFAMAHGCMGDALAFGGNPDAALEAIDRAMRMSPHDPFNAWYLHAAGVAHFAAERYAEGVACDRKALRERPNFAPPRRFLAACLVNLGQLEEARAAVTELLRLQPNSSIKRDAYGYAVYTQSSIQERYVEALRKAGLPEE
jgi:TolB-like protein/class 3 adenylate cyclase/tetratricopeptide (TPR) repeat protein